MAVKKVPRKSLNLLGAWAFLIGIILAVILGLLNGLNLFGAAREPLAWILFLIGLIVGLLNINSQEAQAFLLAGVALVVVSAFGSATLGTIPILNKILEAIMILFVPATVVVALKSVFLLAKH